MEKNSGNEIVSLYHRKFQMDNLVQTLPNSVGAENSKTILGFLSDYSVENAELSVGRKLRLLQGLKHVSKTLDNKSLLSLGEGDLKELSVREQAQGYQT